MGSKMTMTMDLGLFKLNLDPAKVAPVVLAHVAKILHSQFAKRVAPLIFDSQVRPVIRDTWRMGTKTFHCLLRSGASE